MQSRYQGKEPIKIITMKICAEKTKPHYVSGKEIEVKILVKKLVTVDNASLSNDNKTSK